MEPKDAKGRARSRNFTPYEVELLVSAVEQRVGDIENKSNDNASNASKKKAWQDVADIFAQDPGCPHPRNAEQLQLKWENLKKDAKKMLGNYNRLKKATGGGEPPPEPPELFNRIARIIPHEFSRIPNSYDDDAICSGPESPAIDVGSASTPTISSSSECSSPIPIVTVPPDVPPHTLLAIQAPEPAKPTVAPSPTPPGPPVKRRRAVAVPPSSPADGTSDLESIQRELLTFRRQAAEQEHQLKIQMLQAEHALKMRALDWEIKANMAHEQYWREGGPQRPVYTQPMPVALPGVASFISPHGNPT